MEKSQKQSNDWSPVQLWPFVTCLGLLAGSFWTPGPLAWPLLCLGLGSLLIFIFRPERFAAGQLIAGVCLSWALTSPRSQPAQYSGYVEISGPVRQIFHSSWHQRITIQEHRLRFQHQTPIQLGDWVQILGVYKRDSNQRLFIQALELQAHEKRSETWRGLLWEATTKLPRPDALQALFLGAGSPDDRWAFKEAGLLHLLTVSGLHVGIISLLIWLTLRIIGGPWWLKSVGTLIGILLFVAAAGAAPPVLRAGIMAATFVIAQMIGRRLHPIVPLALACWIIWLLDPQAIQRPGTQMSFAAMLGILTIGLEATYWRQQLLPLQAWPLDRPSWRLFLRVCQKNIDALLIGAGACAAIWPVTMWWFGSLTPWSMLATAATVPLLTASLFAGCIVLALSLPLLLVAGSLPQWVWLPAWLWQTSWELLTQTVHLFSQLPHTSLESRQPSIILLVLTITWFVVPWQSATASQRRQTSATLQGIRLGSFAALMFCYLLTT